MKNLEMIIELESGQLAIDFEALELITSEEFVNLIKSDFDFGIIVMKNCEVDVSVHYVRVSILDDLGDLFYYYYKIDTGYCGRRLASSMMCKKWLKLGGDKL